MNPLLRLVLALGLLLTAALGRAAESKLMVAMLPKSKGNGYFISCKVGADKAARELGIQLLFDGPTDSNAAKQNEIVENWITLGVDVIAVAAGSIQVSLGSDDGLQVGHTLEVYRGGEYIGRAVVKSVMPDHSVAELVKAYARGIVQRGDKVTTRLKA